MSTPVILRVIDFINKAAGIVLTTEKAYFIEARLSPVLREENLASVDELMTRAERGDRRLAQRVIDALTTNETFFFRDKSPANIPPICGTVTCDSSSTRTKSGGKKSMSVCGREPGGRALMCRE